jgi:hypothetical protein
MYDRPNGQASAVREVGLALARFTLGGLRFGVPQRSMTAELNGNAAGRARKVTPFSCLPVFLLPYQSYRG